VSARHTRLAPDAGGDLAAAVRAGLGARPRRLPCRFFYDPAGSALFEAICALPEYYLTRAEDEILARHAAAIVARLPRALQLVELGSGAARKTRHLIEAQLARTGGAHYVPIDISASALARAEVELLARYPALTLHSIEAEYTQGLAHLAAEASGAPAARLVLWLGSNVGNFERDAAARFLADATRGFRAEDRFLLGVDLRKARATLEAAYDDRAGITARFNKNLLARVNAELAGDFDLDAFRHVALYDEPAGRIEMHLESLRPQRVRLARLGLELALEAGERIHTEDSYKYSPAEIEALARAAGLGIEARFLDAAGQFCVVLLQGETPAA